MYKQLKSGAICSIAFTLSSFFLLILFNRKVEALTYSPINEAELTSALSSANNGDIIELSADITLTGGGITIDDTIQFRGNSYTLSYAGGGSVVTINAGKSVIMNNLTILNGVATNGGGIYNAGILTATNVLVDSNTASGNGGGIYGTSASSTNLYSSHIQRNYAGANGGGVYTEGGLSIYATTIENNHTDTTDTNETGGGIAIYSTGDEVIDITDSTFFDNSSYWGGGIYTQADIALTLGNVTIVGNDAGATGGGVFLGSNNGGTFSHLLTAVTFAENTSFGMNNGNDVRIEINSTANVSTNLRNTIFGSAGPVNFSAASSGGSWTRTRDYTISRDDSFTSITGTGNLDSTDPKLGTYADHGGPTYTYSLLSDSPAIDAGNSTGAPTDDQRGYTRIGYDIGSYEYFDIDDYLTVVAPTSGQVTNTSIMPINFTTLKNIQANSMVLRLVKGGSTTDYVITDPTTNVAKSFNLDFDGPNTGNIASVTGPLITSGAYTVSYRLVDAEVGNTYTKVIGTFTIDKTVPNVTVNTTARTATGSLDNFNFTISDNNGISSANVSISGSSTATYSNLNCTQSSSINVACTVNITGSGNLIILATDNAGNTKSVTESGFIISAETVATTTPTINYTPVSSNTLQSVEVEDSSIDDKDSVVVLDKSTEQDGEEDIDLEEMNSEDGEQDTSGSSNTSILNYIAVGLAIFIAIALVLYLSGKPKIERE